MISLFETVSDCGLEVLCSVPKHKKAYVHLMKKLQELGGRFHVA